MQQTFTCMRELTCIDFAHALLIEARSWDYPYSKIYLVPRNR